MTAIVQSAEGILTQVIGDPRYTTHLDWGTPRRGHPEGTLRAHIRELEANLEALGSRLTSEERSRVRLLIHVHDTFKPLAKRGVAIADPDSHASLARAFLAELGADPQ